MKIPSITNKIVSTQTWHIFCSPAGNHPEPSAQRLRSVHTTHLFSMTVFSARSGLGSLSGPFVSHLAAPLGLGPPSCHHRCSSCQTRGTPTAPTTASTTAIVICQGVGRVHLDHHLYVLARGAFQINGKFSKENGIHISLILNSIVGSCLKVQFMVGAPETPVGSRKLHYLATRGKWHNIDRDKISQAKVLVMAQNIPCSFISCFA